MRRVALALAGVLLFLTVACAAPGPGSPPAAPAASTTPSATPSAAAAPVEETSWAGRWVPLIGFVLAAAAAGSVGWVLVSSRRS